jgi:hypothetical protein
MTTINGFGTMLYGERSRKPDGTYVATLYLVFVFIPFLPLNSYLVRRLEQGWAFAARVPLSAFCFWWRRLALTMPILLAAGLWGWSSYTSSPSVIENRALAQASASLASHDYVQSLRHLMKLSATSDPGRLARRDDMARSALSQYLSTLQVPSDAERFLGYVVPLVPNSNRAGSRAKRRRGGEGGRRRDDPAGIGPRRLSPPGMDGSLVERTRGAASRARRAGLRLGG